MTMNEAVPEPELPIVDPHHHLYPSNHWADGSPYLLREFAADLASGHRIVSTVYVECGNLQRLTGPEHLRSTGEAAFAAVIGRLADTGKFGPARICEAFIGHADLLSGALVEETVAALLEASEGRLRGIRCAATWDPDPNLSPGARPFGPRGLMATPAFRAGVAKIASLNLVYDAWQYYPQLGELGALADAIPDATIVCGHVGGLVGRGAYAGLDNFRNWKARVTDLAKRPNVLMKLGGLAHDRTGFGYRGRTVRSTEAELIADWKPYIQTCIEEFGAARCMFESNFPVDSVAADYRTLWNVFKKIVAGASTDEKSALFAGTARRVYRLQ
jgi:L-fuconolactonase